MLCDKQAKSKSPNIQADIFDIIIVIDYYKSILFNHSSSHKFEEW